MEIPDRLLNRAMVELSPSEFKLFVWLCRATEKKRQRAITLDELANGIKKNNSDFRVCPGSGLSKKTVERTLKGLEDKKYIQVITDYSNRSRIKKIYKVIK